MPRRFALLAVIAALLATDANATSCADPPWATGSYGFPREAVPIDIQPWIVHRCYEQSVLDDYGTCSLVASEHTVSVTLEVEGEDSCAAEGDYDLAAVLVRFVPDELLKPDLDYALECSAGEVELSLHTRASTAPAAAPEQVVVERTMYMQGDDGCCGTDYIALALADTAPQFLAEGGLIEIASDVGSRFVVSMRDAADAAAPPVRTSFELTPIAANGERGPTTRVERDDIRTQPVYIPCAVAAGSRSQAPWLLGSLLWIAARRRRRAS